MTGERASPDTDGGAAVDTVAVEHAVLDTVRDLVGEVNPTCHARVTPDSALERDLGLDSLTRAELVARVEGALDVRVGPDTLTALVTPRDLVAAVVHAPDAPTALGAWEARPEPSPGLPADVATLVDALEWHASVHPDRVHVRLLDEGGTPVTYARLRTRARRVAAGLAHEDVEPGDTVAVMVPTGADYFAAFMGVLAAGAVPVPIYPPASTANVDDYLRRQIGILRNAQVAALVTFHEAERVARIVRGPVGSLRRVATVAELAATDATDEPRPPVGVDDVALLQYTSGSTGAPKGVVLTHRNLLANVRAMADAARVGPEDVFVSWLPLYHDMGLIGAWLGSLCMGFPLFLMSPLTFLARPVRWLQAVGDVAATISASPNFGYELCARKVADDDLPGLDLSSWRLAFNGAEPVSARTLERFATRFAPCGLRRDALAPVYGLAEAGVGLAFPPPGRAPLVDRIERRTMAHSAVAVPARGPGTDVQEVVACGRPLPGYEIRVVDRAGRVVADRHEGRVEFRGPSATRGYYRDADATAALFDDGWLDTGDLGYLADGDIYLTGRLKDVVIRAGRNLHPRELEEVIDQVPGVRPGCVAVFAVTDAAAGTERLVVAAETRLQDRVPRERLRAAVVEATVDALGTPPDEVVLLPPRTLPKTSSGKIRRSACRERYERGRLARASGHRRLEVARIVLGTRVAAARRTWHALRGLAWAAFAWGVTIVVALAVAVWLLVLPTRRLRVGVVRHALRAVARVVGLHLGVRGVERLPDGGAVIVANHASWIDGAVLAAVLPGAPVFVVAVELSRKPWAGPWLRRLGVEFVHRATHEQGAADTRRLIGHARAGHAVVVFPEGGLARVRGLRPFRLGAFVTAVDAHVPVVPVAIRGTRSVLPPGHRLPRRSDVQVEIGSPIAAPHPGWTGAVALQRAAREHILERCDEPDIA
jgi:1-acyl-sn-glycerol-3-phosphate acyltransferase